MAEEMNFRSQEEPYVQDPPSRGTRTLEYVLRDYENDPPSRVTNERNALRRLLRNSGSQGIGLSFADDIEYSPEQVVGAEECVSDTVETAAPPSQFESILREYKGNSPVHIVEILERDAVRKALASQGTPSKNKSSVNDERFESTASVNESNTAKADTSVNLITFDEVEEEILTEDEIPEYEIEIESQDLLNNAMEVPEESAKVQDKSDEVIRDLEEYLHIARKASQEMEVVGEKDAAEEYPQEGMTDKEADEQAAQLITEKDSLARNPLEQICIEKSPENLPTNEIQLLTVSESEEHEMEREENPIADHEFVVPADPKDKGGKEHNATASSSDSGWMPTMECLKMRMKKKEPLEQMTSAMIKLLPHMRLQKGKESNLQALKHKVTGGKSDGELEEAWQLLEKMLTKPRKTSTIPETSIKKEVSDCPPNVPCGSPIYPLITNDLMGAPCSDTSSSLTDDTVLFVPMSRNPLPDIVELSEEVLLTPSPPSSQHRVPLHSSTPQCTEEADDFPAFEASPENFPTHN